MASAQYHDPQHRTNLDLVTGRGPQHRTNLDLNGPANTGGGSAHDRATVAPSTPSVPISDQEDSSPYTLHGAHYFNDRGSSSPSSPGGTAALPGLGGMPAHTAVSAVRRDTTALPGLGENPVAEASLVTEASHVFGSYVILLVCCPAPFLQNGAV